MYRVKLPYKVKKPILACGADLKGAFALASNEEAFLVDGFGDLGELDNFTRYEKAMTIYRKKLSIKPAIIACDMHPAYFSTCFAENSQLKTHNSQLCKVQHHEAHIASAIIDNSIEGDVIGVAFDGTGYGLDGNIWGGEFFVGDVNNLQRAAHLGYVPMPGGEAVVREPWRMAASYMYRFFGGKFLNLKIDYIKGFNKRDWLILKRMIDKNVNSPLTSSMGRFFDAIGSLVLQKSDASEEAEIPIEFERIAVRDCKNFYSFNINMKDGILIINPAEVIKNVLKDISSGVEKSIISSKFHNGVAGMIKKVALNLRKKFHIKKIVLSGGVFQNKYLTGKVTDMLEKAGFILYQNPRIPVNDIGIAIGQVVIANTRATCA